MSEQTLPATGRAWHLEARPVGRPTPLEFALREVAIAAPGPGQILIANEYLSVDPYMRGRMSDLEAAIGALKLHARIVLSGMVSQYNDEQVVGPRNLWNMSVTRSKMLAFVVTDELDLQPLHPRGRRLGRHRQAAVPRDRRRRPRQHPRRVPRDAARRKRRTDGRPSLRRVRRKYRATGPSISIAATTTK
jgi:N-terminal domain of oxidoreductase